MTASTSDSSNAATAFKLNALPNGVLADILSNIDVQDRQSLRVVSPLLRKFVDANTLRVIVRPIATQHISRPLLQRLPNLITLCLSGWRLSMADQECAEHMQLLCRLLPPRAPNAASGVRSFRTGSPLCPDALTILTRACPSVETAELVLDHEWPAKVREGLDRLTGWRQLRQLSLQRTWLSRADCEVLAARAPNLVKLPYVVLYSGLAGLRVLCQGLAQLQELGAMVWDQYATPPALPLDLGYLSHLARLHTLSLNITDIYQHGPGEAEPVVLHLPRAALGALTSLYLEGFTLLRLDPRAQLWPWTGLRHMHALNLVVDGHALALLAQCEHLCLLHVHCITIGGRRAGALPAVQTLRAAHFYCTDAHDLVAALPSLRTVEFQAANSTVEEVMARVVMLASHFSMQHVRIACVSDVMQHQCQTFITQISHQYCDKGLSITF